MSLDTEGSEEEILEDFDIRKVDVGVFVVEANSLVRVGRLRKILGPNGYRLARQSGVIFLFAKTQDAVALLGTTKIDCPPADCDHPMGPAATNGPSKGRRIIKSG